MCVWNNDNILIINVQNEKPEIAIFDLAVSRAAAPSCMSECATAATRLMMIFKYHDKFLRLRRDSFTSIGSCKVSVVKLWWRSPTSACHEALRKPGVMAMMRT